LGVGIWVRGKRITAPPTSLGTACVIALSYLTFLAVLLFILTYFLVKKQYIHRENSKEKNKFFLPAEPQFHSRNYIIIFFPKTLKFFFT
jgi:hypothetical protein